MAPKGGNAKKESGRAKKAENEAKKAEAKAHEKERAEAAKWSDGSKGKSSKDAKEEKRREELAKKAERERLLAAEEASAPSKPKAAPKAGAKKKVEPKPAGPGAIAAGGGIASKKSEKEERIDTEGPQEVESFAATGVDAALELLDVVNAKKDKASVGAQAATLEKHPERRFKSAFESYQDRELPRLKDEHPGLRLQQYKDLLYKKFQKSPENPFNQTTVAFDASKEERVEALERRNREIEERLREKTGALSLGN